jgi:TonB-linked SusC/RagA family outer membrane protein
VYSVSRDNAKRDLRQTRNLGSFYAELRPLTGLTLRGEVGVDHGQYRDYSWISGRLRPEEYLPEDLANDMRDTLDYPYQDGKSRYNLEEGSNTTFNYTATANYTFDAGADHGFDLLLGIEALNSTNDRMITELENAGSNQDESVIGNFIRDPDQLLEISNDGGEETRFFSQFGRLNYSFQDRYLLQGSLRRDGSSKFTPEDRFSYFPSVSAGWIVSDENFLPETSLLSFLKVRAGWGVTGNANIGSFLFLDNFVNWPNYPDRSGAQVLNQLGSRSIQWEKSNTTDFAVEFGLFDNRVSGSVGYYYSKTTNLLLSFPVTPSTGIYATNGLSPTALDNVGSLQNQGFELELRTINLNVNRFRWSTEFNLTTNKNKVLELYPGFDGDPRQLSFGGLTTVQEGEPLGMFFLPEFAGYDDSGNLLIREIDQDLAENQVYEFTGNDVRATRNATRDNSVIQYGKTGLPTFYGGFKNTFSYAGLSLDVLFTYQGGNYIYDDIGLRRVGRGTNNLRADLVGNTWTPSNPDAEYQALTWNNLENNPADGSDPVAINDRSTRDLVKGDFIRLRNISLSYQLPRNLFVNNFLDGARFYVNLNNVATFSKFDATDPEIVNTGGAQARNLGQGVVGGVPYWQVFTATFGVNIRL